MWLREGVRVFVCICQGAGEGAAEEHTSGSAAWAGLERGFVAEGGLFGMGR